MVCSIPPKTSCAKRNILQAKYCLTYLVSLHYFANMFVAKIIHSLKIFFVNFRIKFQLPHKAKLNSSGGKFGLATDCSNEVCGTIVLKKFIEFYWLRSLMIIAGESSRCVWFVRTLELAMLGRTLNIIPFEIIIQWFTRIAIGTYFVRRPTDGRTDAATTTELSKYVDLWFELVLIKLPHTIQWSQSRQSFPKFPTFRLILV